jgi:hypothetical protein
MDIEKWIFRILVLIAGTTFLYLLFGSLDDIKRYAKISTM